MTITREVAIELKGTILKTKTVSTFNGYLMYFNALKFIGKKTSIASKRRASTEQLKTRFQFAEQYGKNNMRYWLIMIGRYTDARMNEICQLKLNDVTAGCVHIRGEVLKTDNAKRSIPTHPKLIELGLLDWVRKCTGKRLFHEWRSVKGSYSHAGSRWFGRNNPFKSNIKGQKAEVDFHSLRHTVATEMKQAGVPSQFAAQIRGHSNGNITYDRYGKDVNPQYLNLQLKL